MQVTSTRVRLLRGKGIYAIASVTIDYELTINDIKVFRQGADFNLRFPNTENAKQNNQFSIHADEHIYKEIKAAVLRQIDGCGFKANRQPVIEARNIRAMY